MTTIQTETPENHDGFGAVHHQSLPRIRQIAGARLQAAWTTVPQVTHHEQADVTTLDERRRESASIKRVSLLAALLPIILNVLRKHPRLLSSLSKDGKSIIMKDYLHLGLAIETAQGLVVGVVREADQLPAEALARSIDEMAALAREGRLPPTQMEGASFTISSLGHIGGTGFTPIVNPPNVAILGICQARWQPAVIDSRIVPRLLVPLSLSYDHRVLDGADAARFCRDLREQLSAAAID